jgi:hypothetical protein
MPINFSFIKKHHQSVACFWLVSNLIAIAIGEAEKIKIKNRNFFIIFNLKREYVGSFTKKYLKQCMSETYN